jgi:hypothetical protein
MRFSHRKGLVDRESYVAQYIALVLFVIGIAALTDDLLAACAAGCGLVSLTLIMIDALQQELH